MENRFLRCAQAGLFDLLKRHHSGGFHSTFVKSDAMQIGT